MFRVLAHLTVEPTLLYRGTQKVGAKERLPHKLATGGDIALGVALLIIGICATQLGFLPSGVQYGLIGAGSAYTFVIVIGLAVRIKQQKAPDAFLFKSTPEVIPKIQVKGIKEE